MGRIAGLVAALLVAAGAAGATTPETPAPAVSGAILTASAAAGATVASGRWHLYLHALPTPPTGNTPAAFGQPLDTAAPTATGLYNLDTDCDSAAGRVIERGAGAVGETVPCRYATWRTPAYAVAQPLAGSARLMVYARKSANGGQAPTLRAYLRDHDPWTGAEVELGTGSATVTTNGNRPFAALTVTIALSATVPAGHELELELVASGGNRDVEIAYDTTSDASALVLP